MKAKILDFSMGYMNGGKQRLLLEFDGDITELYEDLKDKDVNVELKQYRKKRSANANAYAWVLIGKIAENQQLSPEEVYKETIQNIPGVYSVVCCKEEAAEKFRQGWSAKGIGWQTEELDSKLEGCKNIVVWYGSSVYDTKQMSALIDKLIQDCKALGIPTDTPEEIERMKALWH
jgi:hypothetical protein